MGTFKDLTGQVFGRWTVLKHAGWYNTPSTGAKSSLWSCVCDCKNTRVVRGINLTTGKSMSCGCLRLENIVKGATGQTHRRIDPTTSAENLYYRSIVKGAKRRGYSVELSKVVLVKIGRKPCHYCGTRDVFKGAAEQYRRTCVKQKTSVDIPFYDSKIQVLNGIDRVDNTKGYIKGNVVSCCYDCNTAKMDRPIDEFVTWIKKAAAHLQKEHV